MMRIFFPTATVDYCLDQRSPSFPALDQWHWGRGEDFTCMPFAQMQLCMHACPLLLQPGSQRALAWHWATAQELATPDLGYR